MNKSLIIIILVLVAVGAYFLYNHFSLKRQIESMPKSDVDTENGWVSEDNIIVIDGLEKERAPKIVSQLREMYPSEMNSRWDGDHFILSYTHGMEFRVFCYVVNYLVYPFDMTGNNKLTVKAWCTTSGIEWGGSNELMLYVPDGDTEHDVTFISTKDGHCFKQMFGVPEPCIIVEELVMPYEERQK